MTPSMLAWLHVLQAHASVNARRRSPAVLGRRRNYQRIHTVPHAIDPGARSIRVHHFTCFTMLMKTPDISHWLYASCLHSHIS